MDSKQSFTQILILVSVLADPTLAILPAPTTWQAMSSPLPTGSPRSSPSYWGCQDDISRSQSYCDSSLPISQRVAALVDNLTLSEQISLIGPTSTDGFTLCSTFTPTPAKKGSTMGISRVGLPTWKWITETNSGAGAQCIGKEKCATVFVGPMGMAASFNRSSWRQKGTVTGTETRAFVNDDHLRKRRQPPPSLSGYGPNINIYRDPRFGRASELPSEDPFLAGSYATEFLQGSQEKDAQGRPKMISLLKHFAAYSQEKNRGADSYDISTHDLFETYLPQYEMAFKQGGAAGAMCSYTGVNGQPSCANGFLLNHVLRGKWNMTDALVTSDCGAINKLHHYPANAPSPEAAAAFALK